MKLIDFLVSKGHSGWCWPNGMVKATCNIGSAAVNFYLDYSCPPTLSEMLIANRNFDEPSCISREQYEAALAASKPEWDGRGLPPSGVEFEYLRGDFGADEGRWVKCTMKYAGDKFCIVHLEGDGESWLKHEGTKIRPVRSESDKKRDEAVEAMIKHKDDQIAVTENYYHAIYDAIAAGKIPHIRID